MTDGGAGSPRSAPGRPRLSRDGPRAKRARPSQSPARKSEISSAGLRATIDARPEKIGAKIRDAQLEKIPVMLVVGVKEAESETVSYRERLEGDRGALPLNRSVAQLKSESDARVTNQVTPEEAPASVESGDGERHSY